MIINQILLMVHLYLNSYIINIDELVCKHLLGFRNSSVVYSKFDNQLLGASWKFTENLIRNKMLCIPFLSWLLSMPEGSILCLRFPIQNWLRLNTTPWMLRSLRFHFFYQDKQIVANYIASLSIKNDDDAIRQTDNYSYLCWCMYIKYVYLKFTIPYLKFCLFSNG